MQFYFIFSPFKNIGHSNSDNNTESLCYSLNIQSSLSTDLVGFSKISKIHNDICFSTVEDLNTFSYNYVTIHYVKVVAGFLGRILLT